MLLASLACDFSEKLLRLGFFKWHVTCGEKEKLIITAPIDIILMAWRVFARVIKADK